MPEGAATPLRILVADGDPSVGRLYAAFARSRGHSVLLASDGPGALAAAAAELPDVVLLDIEVPKLDARDVLRALKENSRTAAIPVLVLTVSGGDQNVRNLLLELGALDVLEKPVDLPMAFTKAERLAHARW